MTTYLFCTSDEIRQPQRPVQSGKAVGKKPARATWSIGCYRRPKPGDTFFLIRTTGKAPGIIGAGRITSRPFSGPHRRYPGYESNYLHIEFEKLAARAPAVLVPADKLKKTPFHAQHWRTRSSGIPIKPQVARALKSLTAATRRRDHLRST
jgi:hypothetical protein